MRSVILVQRTSHGGIALAAILMLVAVQPGASAQSDTAVGDDEPLMERSAQPLDAAATPEIVHPLETLWRDLSEDSRPTCAADAGAEGEAVRTYPSRRLVQALVRAYLVPADASRDRIYGQSEFRRWLGAAVGARMRTLRAADQRGETDPELEADAISRMARALARMLTLENGEDKGDSILSWMVEDGRRVELRHTEQLIFARHKQYEDTLLSQVLNAPDSWAENLIADRHQRFRIIASCPEQRDEFLSAERARRIDGPITWVRRSLRVGATERDVSRPLSQRRGAGVAVNLNNESQTQIWDWEFALSVDPWSLPTPWSANTPEKINRDFFEHFSTMPERDFTYRLSGTEVRPYLAVKRRAIIDEEDDTTDVDVDFVTAGFEVSSFIERGRARSREVCRTPEMRGNRECAIIALDDDIHHEERTYKASRFRIQAPVSLEWVTDTSFESSFARAQVQLTPSVGLIGDPRTTFPVPGFQQLPLIRRAISPYMQVITSPAVDYAEVFEPGDTLPLQDIDRYVRVGGDFELNMHFNGVFASTGSRLRWLTSYRLREDLTQDALADAALFQSELNVLLPGDRFSLGLQFEEGEDPRTLERDERVQFVARYRM